MGSPSQAGLSTLPFQYRRIRVSSTRPLEAGTTLGIPCRSNPQLGVPVAVAQAQLGHADPRITLSIYTHVIPGAQRQAVEQLERHLFPNCSQVVSRASNCEHDQMGLTDSEESRKGMVGATGIEPMTSTVSR